MYAQGIIIIKYRMFSMFFFFFSSLTVSRWSWGSQVCQLREKITLVWVLFCEPPSTLTSWDVSVTRAASGSSIPCESWTREKETISIRCMYARVNVRRLWERLEQIRGRRRPAKVLSDRVNVFIYIYSTKQFLSTPPSFLSPLYRTYSTQWRVDSTRRFWNDTGSKRRVIDDNNKDRRLQGEHRDERRRVAAGVWVRWIPIMVRR